MSVTNWETHSLGDVADLIMGQSPESKYYSDEEVGLPFLQGCAEFQSKFPKHALYCSQIKKVAPEGSILFSVRAPVGKMNIADRDYIIGRGLAGISATRVSQEYLEHYLGFEESKFRNASQGSTFEAINSSELSRWPIKHPKDKPEQTKIAEVLSTVDRAIEQTEALIAKQQRIKTGLMQDLLTKGIDEHGNLRSEATHEFKDSPLGRIPVEWEAPTIEDLLSRKTLGGVQDGNHGEKHPKSRDFVSEGIPFVMATDIAHGFVDVGNAKKITEEQYLSLRIGFAQPRDVLLSHKASIGFVALVPESLPRLMLTPQVTYYRVDDTSTLLPEYLAQFFRSELYQETLKGLAKQSTRDYIGILAQRKLRIAFPIRIGEQEKIEQILSAEDDREQALRRSLRKFRSMKTALMQDLLTGKKRVTPLLETDTTD